jgi:hypothetical protein
VGHASVVACRIERGRFEWLNYPSILPGVDGVGGVPVQKIQRQLTNLDDDDFFIQVRLRYNL